ncbi:hypothetical protein M885DRAFT_519667, partial [Pelagophyceae sp. CCMP2097]
MHTVTRERRATGGDVHSKYAVPAFRYHTQRTTSSSPQKGPRHRRCGYDADDAATATTHYPPSRTLLIDPRRRLRIASLLYNGKKKLTSADSPWAPERLLRCVAAGMNFSNCEVGFSARSKHGGRSRRIRLGQGDVPGSALSTTRARRQPIKAWGLRTCFLQFTVRFGHECKGGSYASKDRDAPAELWPPTFPPLPRLSDE